MFTDAATADKRVALVIGNSAYQSVPRLPNPVHDAADIAGAFKRLGFAVTTVLDLDSSRMRQALRAFGQTATGAEIAVVFYAGHGIEVSSSNFLIPVDAKLRNDRDVHFEAIPLELVMTAVSGAKGLRIVLLDACRNNPFTATMRSTSLKRSIGRGFGRIEPVRGTLVGYAAREGTTADDGDDRNSPYTKALLDHIEQPGLEINFLFRKVRDQVFASTNGRQEPFTYGSLPGRQIFLKAPEVVKQPTVDSQRLLLERAAWDLVKDAKNAALVASYLSRYPDGRFSIEAKVLLNRLEAQDKARRAARDKAKKENDARLLREAEARLKAEERRLEQARKQAIRNAWQTAIEAGSIDAMMRFAIRYPDSKHTGEANRRIAQLRRKQEAKVALRPPDPVPDDTAAQRPQDDLATQLKITLGIQRHLNRLGCNAGRADGQWGRNSRRALKAFSRHGKVRLASLEPTKDALAALQRQKSRICPPVCSRRHVLDGNRCKLKVCPTGRQLSNTGKCVPKAKGRKKQKPKASVRLKPKVRTRNQGTGGKCGVCWSTKEAGARRVRYCGTQYSSRAVRGWCQ